MQAGIARYGRTVLAALTAAALMLSLVILLANPANANHEPPDDEVANDGPAGTNEAPYWETYLANVRGITDATCSKINQASDDAWVMPAEPAGQDWVLLVVKQANTNYVFYDPIAGHSYPSVGDNAPGYSHIIVCSADEPEETTTTTTVEETTTTVEETTTTVEETTTTTQPTTSTTQPTTTTSSTIPDQVLALVFVTVDERCTVVDDEGEGRITVGVSVDDAATVVIRNSSGSVVASVSRDTVITVPEGAKYSWEATPSEGFEFASDFVAEGELDIETCTEDEVKGIEVLPFTGVEAQTLAVMAAVLSALGLLVILATRRVED